MLFIQWIDIDVTVPMSSTTFNSMKPIIKSYFYSNLAKVQKVINTCNSLLARNHQTFPWKCAHSPGSNWILHTLRHDISRDSQNPDSVQTNNHGQTLRLSSNLQAKDFCNFLWCDDTSWCIHLERCHFFLNNSNTETLCEKKLRINGLYVNYLFLDLYLLAPSPSMVVVLPTENLVSQLIWSYRLSQSYRDSVLSTPERICVYFQNYFALDLPDSISLSYHRHLAFVKCIPYWFDWIANVQWSAT